MSLPSTVPAVPCLPFDPAAQGQFDLDSPPSPWLDLGWIENFQRTAATKYDALRSGPSGSITVQYRSQPEARVDFDLPSWGKLQMAIAGGCPADERAGRHARQACPKVRVARPFRLSVAGRVPP